MHPEGVFVSARAKSGTNYRLDATYKRGMSVLFELRLSTDRLKLATEEKLFSKNLPYS